MTPAGWGPRIGAALVDLVIVSVVTWLVMIPFGKFAHLDEMQERLKTMNQNLAGGGLPDASDFQPLMQMALILFLGLLVCIAIVHVYYVYFETSTGQTPGKRLLRLRVVTTDGGKLTTKQAVYREMLRWYVDGLFLFPAFISMAVTPRRQRVGDLAAETMVVVVPREAPAIPWP